MSIEFLLLIGVFIVFLEQIRRLRALNAQQKSDFESQLAAKQATIDSLTEQLNGVNSGEVQAELNALEAELTPADPTKTPA